jgi:hypothetical protein
VLAQVVDVERSLQHRAEEPCVSHRGGRCAASTTRA